MKFKTFLVFSLIISFTSKLHSQVVTDWVFPVDSLGEANPIDVSNIFEAARRESNKVFIIGYNRDNGASNYNLLDYVIRQRNIGNYDPIKTKMCFYNNSEKQNPRKGNDVWFRFGHSIENRNMGGVKSFYLLVTSNAEFNNSNIYTSLNLRKLDLQHVAVQVYICEGVEVQEQFFWNLRQILLFFSNYDFIPNSNEKVNIPKERKFKTFIDLQWCKGFGKGASTTKCSSASVGISLKTGPLKQNEISFNVGLQQSNDFWNKENFQNQVVSVLNPNQQLDEILVLSSNVKEDYTLSATSAAIGLEIRSYLGKSRSFIGVYGNAVKPFIYDLNFTNTSGEFDYVGISNSIQEPLTNIPELGLVSGVSYVGYKSELTGKLKTFYDFGLMSGYSFGEKSPLDINLSVGLTTAKKFNLDQSKSAISSSYGDYNSLATVNTTQIAVPRFLNVGLSVRKYLN
jgi:hypothetical protein